MASFSALPTLPATLILLSSLPSLSLAFIPQGIRTIDPARIVRVGAMPTSMPYDDGAMPTPPPTTAAAGVIFDIDGTLADSWKLGYDATVAVLNGNDYGHVEINEDLYHATCVYPTPERLARTAGLMPGDGDFEAVGEDLGRQFDDSYVRLVSLQTCAFYEGVLDILQNLPEGTKLGALTNACVAYGHAVLRANCPAQAALGGADATGLFALYDRFGVIHGADSVPAAKPSPDGLLQCAAELGLEPRDCIYVGDAVGDGKAARAAGMVSIGVLWGSNSEEKLRKAETFDYICASREDLRQLLPQSRQDQTDGLKMPS